MSAQHLALLFVCIASVAACKNSNYCAGNPFDDCRLMWDASIDADAANTCGGNGDCKAPTGVCDLGGTLMCVQCTTSDNPCPSAMPLCIANQCQKCTAHTQCTASNVCLPDGSCADETQVAYVAMSGSGTACTKANPCRTLDDGLNANKPTVKLAGLVKDNKITTINARTVTIVADPGAKLDRDGDGPILQVQNNGTDVRIYDLEITGASGGAGADGIELIPNGGNPKLSLTRVTIDGNNDLGISNTGGTLTVFQSTMSENMGGGVSTSGGTLTVSQSTVSANPGGGISASGGTLTVSRSTISGNSGGGISISGAPFDVTNSMIVGNGGPGTAFGGVRLDQTNTGTRRFDFNTVSNNNGNTGVVTGVVCTLVTQVVTFSDNIVFDNQIGGGRTQVGGNNCSWNYSDIGPDTGSVTGANNINVDPMFASPALGNFHLLGTSPAKDAADPAATVGVDFDGDSRPQGSRRDMGADEVRQ